MTRVTMRLTQDGDRSGAAFASHEPVVTSSWISLAFLIVWLAFGAGGPWFVISSAATQDAPSGQVVDGALTEARMADTPAPMSAVALSPSSDAIASDAARATEVDAVLGTIAAYAAALSEMNAGKAAQAWPTIDQRNLVLAFSTLEDNAVALNACAIEFAGNNGATAMCRVQAEYVPKVGRRTPRRFAQQWRFTMSKSFDAWKILSGTISNEQ